MRIIRTIIWVLLLVALAVFAIANWGPTVTVRIWQGLVLDTKVPVIVLASFAIGFVPLWLYHRAAKWQMGRRIAGLEATARATAAAALAAEAPAADLSPNSPAGPA